MAKKKKTQPKVHTRSLKKKKTSTSKSKKKSLKPPQKKTAKKTTKKSTKKIVQKKSNKTKQAPSKKSKSLKSTQKKLSSKIKTKKADKKSASKKQKIKPFEKKTIAHSKNKPTHFLSYWEQELERILEKNRQVSIKGSEGFEYCFEDNCDQPATTKGYCRYHYMVSWKSIKARGKILSENQLNKWIKELVGLCSPRVLDLMVRDFSNEKDFSQALVEMKILSKH